MENSKESKEEEDEYEERINRTGCKDSNDKVLQCYSKYKDWRLCSEEVKEMRLCFSKYLEKKTKKNE